MLHVLAQLLTIYMYLGGDCFPHHQFSAADKWFSFMAAFIFCLCWGVFFQLFVGIFNTCGGKNINNKNHSTIDRKFQQAKSVELI